MTDNNVNVYDRESREDPVKLEVKGTKWAFSVHIPPWLTRWVIITFGASLL